LSDSQKHSSRFVLVSGQNPGRLIRVDSVVLWLQMPNSGDDGRVEALE